VRLFVAFAAITLVPVLVLGAVLAASYRSEARRRGIAEGRSEAALLAKTTIEPILGPSDLSMGLSDDERTRVERVVARSVVDGDLLRLRIRDLLGHVVYSDDGSGLASQPDDEAIEVAGGAVVTKITSLNVDSNDSGPAGRAAVEAYRPLRGGLQGNIVGVLEVYLPYAPIGHDVNAGLQSLYRNLAVGLAMLYLAVFAVSAVVSRGLRRQLSVNAFLAEHDTLTELPNRTLFQARARTAVAATERRGKPVAIAIADLDRFKEVNDTLGHHNGDRLLAELARRLAAHARDDDTVARLGGDEFGIVLRDVDDADGALQRLREIIDHEVEVSGLPLSVEASIGYVLAPDDGTDVDELLQRADVAMYVAKSQHAGVVRYDATHNHYDAANLSLIGELRHAIDADQLVLHYQPKATLSDRRVEAIEALVRWQHPSLGLLYPDRFLPLAEQTDVIDRLTTWVLTRALRDVAGLDDQLAIAVNVSARNLADADFGTRVVDLLRQAGVAPQRLIIEITETALLADPARAAAILIDLDMAGVKVSIDDFGKGQTSLGYLSQLRVHELKIDRTFVSDMLVNRAHAAIVRSIVDLGHNLALRVVGEGVETEDVLRGLREAGCDVAQGYLLARPMPLAQLRQWLSGSEASGVEERVLLGRGEVTRFEAR
jgi:diguanylate cyclase (GGDEF)-like protein